MPIRIQQYATSPRRVQVGGIDPGFQQALIRHVGQDAAASTTQALLDAGKQLTEVGIKEYVSQETARVSQALQDYKAQLSAEQERYTTTNQGQNALDAGRHFDRFAREAAAPLAEKFSGKFRTMFMQDAAAFGLRFTEQGQAYAGQQEKAWKKSQWDGDVAQTMDSIAQDPGNKDFIETALGNLKGRYAEMFPGMDYRAVDAEINHKAAGIIIDSFLAKEDVGRARGAFEQYKGILGAAAPQYEARIRSMGRELQARARAEAERAEGEAAISVVSGLLNDTVGLTRQERESAVLARIAEEPDLKKRHRMASLAKSELAFEELRETAQTEKQIVDFYDETKGMTPIQQMQHLETSTNISAAARDKLRPKLSTEWHRETPQNQAALSDVMLDIDKAKAAGLPNSDIEQRVYARAAVRGLTPEQTKKAVKYAQEGGSTGSLKFSEANSIWKRLTGKKEMPAEAFETLRSQLPQGREATAADIERVLANFYMSGKSADSGWFSDSENYLESLKHGRGEAWLPNVTDQEKKDISKLLQRAGVAVSLEKIRKYKKHVIMGIPEEIGGSK